MKTIPFLVLVAVTVLGAGCKKEFAALSGTLTPMKRNDVYTLQKGQQYCSPKPFADMGNKNQLHFAVRFQKSTAAYTVDELASYNQVNKLFGFNDCGAVSNRTDSARVGWYFHEISASNYARLSAADRGKVSAYGTIDAPKYYVMDVLPFVDHNGQHEYDVKNPLATLDLDRFYEYKIEILGAQYLFSIIDDTGTLLKAISVTRHCSGTAGEKFMNFPYFGGTSPAPHTMAIDLNLLD